MLQRNGHNVVRQTDPSSCMHVDAANPPFVRRQRASLSGPLHTNRRMLRASHKVT